MAGVARAATHPDQGGQRRLAALTKWLALPRTASRQHVTHGQAYGHGHGFERLVFSGLVGAPRWCCFTV